MFDRKEFDRMFKDVPDNSFLTICDEADASRYAYGLHGPIRICLREYRPDEYRKIRAQADEWVIQKEYEEFYDYDAYANLGGSFVEYSSSKIDDKRILIRNGVFVGIVYYLLEGDSRFTKQITNQQTGIVYYPVNQDSKPQYISVKDYQGDPLLLTSEYTPVPRDNIEEPAVTVMYYLVKKAEAK